MGLIDDPISGIIGLFMKRALEAKIGQRITLLLEMSIASSIAALGACGLALLAHQAVAWSIGAGMVAAAIALLATFQASPNSKGLIISLPQATSEEKLDTPMTTISKEK